MFDTNFSSLDWGIVAVYLVGTGLVGMYVNRHVHNAADYLVGGRQAGTALSISSYIGTGLGLVTLMYASMDGFTRGFSYLFVPLLGGLVSLGLGTTGFVIRRLRSMKLTTIPEYFERRFNSRVRVTAGVICVVAGVLNMGLFPKMGATFITWVSGMGGAGGSAEITVNVITSLLILLVLAYTVLGGMVAVLVTDYLQFVVLSVGLAVGLAICFLSPELGWNRIVETWAAQRGEAAFNPVHADSYGWTYVVWMSCVTLTASLCWAPEATRALTTQDEATTQRTFLLGAPGFFTRMAAPALWGIAAYVYMSHHAELSVYFRTDLPPGADRADDWGRPEQAMPLFLGNVIPAGLLGVLVAGLMAAFMSTHDSYLLAWASVVSQDVVAPLKKRPVTDRESIFYTRITVVAVGLFLLVWGVWYELPESVWTYMAVTGTIYLSGCATALLGGMYWKRASSAGALWSMLGGLTAIACLFVEPLQSWLAETGRPGLAESCTSEAIALGVYCLCAALFVTGSLLFPDAPREGDSP